MVKEAEDDKKAKERIDKDKLAAKLEAEEKENIQAATKEAENHNSKKEEYGGGALDVEIISSDQRNRIISSGVGFTDSERLIGEAAKNQAGEITTMDVKRLISQKLDDKQVQKDRKLVPDQTVNKDGKTWGSPWGAYRSSSVEQNMDFSKESSSDEEVESEDELDPKGISMICPRRSAVLDLLPLDLRMRLMENVSEPITTRWARHVFG
ncbi:unnamed protein product [Arabis nemorensis]|uniref:Uncharacterized protein n=1 Tax=Arabis nemorensis TaxID=586526 RepID=A0A565B892_9BRAS|nr:unnamed protein product [Arabis nemorensis]